MAIHSTTSTQWCWARTGKESSKRSARRSKAVFQGWFELSKVTFQQYALVPAEITAKVRVARPTDEVSACRLSQLRLTSARALQIPENISFDQAASIPLGFATVFTALWNSDPGAQAHAVGFPAPWEEGGGTQFAGKPIFIIGGSSSVGQYAIQLAKLSKFSPIITTASPHNVSLLQSLGATHVLDRALSPSEVFYALREITGANGAPLEVVYDAISHGNTQVLGYEALAPGGVLVIVNTESIPAEVKERAKGEEKKVVMSWGTVHMPENQKIGVEVYRRLTGWLTDGVIVIRLGRNVR
ncbi:hypothetical protein C8Q80DRAFT_613479 [Daedaleopsis nitida]|nr:hypothetical protein C8Q80DRAFT_613479 [Daedaleopsis nitida]